MATANNKDTWRNHELIAKAIFEAFLKQDAPKTWKIKHNKKVVGRSTTHQIDIYWKFRIADLEHVVIVQVKKEKERAKQGDLLLFRAVLCDIPGQPKGIFISQAGYQKGALRVARSSGITVFELREIDQTSRSSITITTCSVIKFRIRDDIFAIEHTYLVPTFEHLRFEVDPQWVDQHPEAWPLTAETQSCGGLEFVDGDGNVRTTMQKLVQDRLGEFGDGGRTQLDITFPEPTYLAGGRFVNKAGKSVDKFRILRIIVDLDIAKTTSVRPWFSDSTATYLLKNAVENHTRYALIAEQEGELTEPVAIIGRRTRAKPRSD